MRPITRTFLAQLHAAPLLRDIGKPHTLAYRSAGSWEDALNGLRSESWGALQLMTNNRNSSVVNRLNWDRYQDWNPVCATLRPEVDKIADAALSGVRHTREVTTELRDSLAWDLLCMLLEREFEDVTTPAFYLPVLFPVYESGHLPCGWAGPWLDTDWSAGSAPLPAGDVLIY